MSKSIEKNEILCDIIQKSIDIFQLYGLMAGKLEINVNTKHQNGFVTISYKQKENGEEIIVSRRIT